MQSCVGPPATARRCPWGGAALRRLRLWMLQEPQIEGHEYQDNSDVYYEPRPELVPEEQDVHADHDGYHREHVKHDGRLSSHRLFLLWVDPRCPRAAVDRGDGVSTLLGLSRAMDPSER